MKASKFWITATTAVAAAGAIGLAVAQTVNPQSPTPDPQTVGNPTATQPPNSATGSGMSSGATTTSPAATDAPASSVPAQADRN